MLLICLAAEKMLISNVFDEAVRTFSKTIAFVCFLKKQISIMFCL